MAKKVTAKKAVAEVKEVAAVQAEEVKVEPVVEAVKVEEVKAEPVKEEAVVVEKKAPAKRTATKKATKAEAPAEEKKAPAKKTTAKKEVKANVVLQFAGQEASIDVVVANAKNAFVAEGHKESEIKEIQIYVKPEEYAAYYVINQEFSGRVNLF